MVDPRCGESAIVSICIIDPGDKRQLEWYWGLRHGQFKLTDSTVRLRADMARGKGRVDPWVVLPEPDLLQTMSDCVDYNSSCKSVTSRRSIENILALPYHDYLFYAPLSKPRVYCTYDDGTCEAFDHPYTHFPRVRSSLSPWLLVLGMYDHLLNYAMSPIFDQFSRVANIMDRCEKKFPFRFYWGPIRRSLQHPDSVAESFCVTESGSESAAGRRSGMHSLNNPTSSADKTTALDVSRILMWRAQVCECGVGALPIFDDLPPSHERARRPHGFALSHLTVGECGRPDTTRYTSNDWAHRKLRVSLWRRDGDRRWRMRQQRRSRGSRRVKQTAQAVVAPSVISCPRPESPEDDCATACAPLASPRMKERQALSRSPSPAPRTVLHALKEVKADIRTNKENLPPCVAPHPARCGKRRYHEVEAMPFQPPRKRIHRD
ncbi:hypothetical protein FISHEDRAFT_75804 [Fistulina hepatica ATCC 64428]|uniref:Uncharacterized protein n=1 Tax=Fistulina hepatica ATCC 64428 TaxID=1128425 RepID=A0A0D7A674_9AGAR|nr:hypothetical protein FISHEDRAFT_75804 [Fistulina hepatica ATCC 64428]